jgi:hypothetical protein
VNREIHTQTSHRRKAKGIEFLVCDALFEARDLLGLAEAAEDVERFLALDDRVLALVGSGTGWRARGGIAARAPGRVVLRAKLKASLPGPYH